MKTLPLILTGLLAGAAFSATAGRVRPAPIIIDTVARTAGGDMVTARFSDNDSEFIGCGSRTYLWSDGSHSQFGFCQAKNATGERAFCNTDDAELVEAIGRLSDFAYVTFSWNADGSCQRIGSSTQSFYLPQLGEENEEDDD